MHILAVCVLPVPAVPNNNKRHLGGVSVDGVGKA